MTIQMNIGVQPLKILPGLSAEAHWVDSLPNQDLPNLAELGELKSIKLQYTSLRDLIAVSSMKQGSSNLNETGWCDISQVKLKDRLLKQAARAYLQPAGIEVTPKDHFFFRCWKSLTSTKKALVACLHDFLQTHVKACSSFFRILAYRLIKEIKPQYFGVLLVKANNSG